MYSFGVNPRYNSGLSPLQAQQPIPGRYYNKHDVDSEHVRSLYTQVPPGVDAHEWKEDWPLYHVPGRNVAFFNVKKLDQTIAPYDAIEFLGFASTNSIKCRDAQQVGYYRGYSTVPLLVKGPVAVGDILYFTPEMGKVKFSEGGTPIDTYIVSTMKNPTNLFGEMLNIPTSGGPRHEIRQDFDGEINDMRTTVYSDQKKVKLTLWQLYNLINKQFADNGVNDTNAVKAGKVLDGLAPDIVRKLQQLSLLMNQMNRSKVIGTAQSVVEQKATVTSLCSVWILT